MSQRKTMTAPLLPPADPTWSAEDWRERYDKRLWAAEQVAGMSRGDAEREAYTSCIAEFLNANPPSPSADDRCAWCEKVETAGTPLRPYGSEPGTWLHEDCWDSWYRGRRAEAADSLARMGVIDRQRRNISAPLGCLPNGITEGNT
jgi:hypothetical protein